MIGKCEEDRLEYKSKCQNRGTNTHNIWQKIMKGIKTTHNKIDA
jgi:hypothetical protein